MIAELLRNLFNKNLDGFTSSVIDGSAGINNSRLEVKINSNISGGVPEKYAKVTSDEVVDLTDSYVRIELVQPSVSTSNVVAFLRLYEDSADGSFTFYYKGGSLYAQYVDTSGDVTALGNVAYNRQEHKHLQIRNDDTNVKYEVSNDLINWTTLFATTFDVDLTDLKIEIGIELTESETEFNTVAFANLNVITPVILPNRRFYIKTGFEDELVDKFNGIAEYPDSRIEETKFHIYDVLEVISDFKLSAGGLDENLRTDIYINGILDEVFDDYFTSLATMESAESWTLADTADDATLTDDSSNFRYGSNAKKLTVDNGTATITKTISADLSAFDSFAFDVWVDDINAIDELNLYLGDGADFFTYELTGLNIGWNYFKISKADFDITGSPSWSSIDDLEFELVTVASEIAEINVDEFRIVDTVNYPQRIFDSGVAVIPVVWWGGNSALFEIKTASEAEGARFFADEQGRLIFQNRQHFNVNPEFKQSKYGFNFDYAKDLIYTGRLSDVINKVTIELKPRRKQSTQVIWSYFDVPKSIGAGQTLTIWANFNDPVFNVVTPVSTTDYIGNGNSDGSGVDRTSDIDITITKFGTSAKLEIENTSGTTLYLTKMELRGQPATESSTVLIEAENAESISRYGVQPSGGLVISNKYAVDEEYAQSLADILVEQYGTPNARVQIKGRSIAYLQLGDMVSVFNEYLNETYIMRIIQIKESFSQGGYNADYLLRYVSGFETLDFFTVGVSAIEGEDVISA